MPFAFTEEQSAIKEAARSFLESRVSAEDLRTTFDTWGIDATLWRALAEEMGWLGVAIPEKHAGLALGAVELAILMEETGRLLAPVPFFTTAGLGVPLISATAKQQQQQALFPQIVAGAAKIAVCLTGPSGTPYPQDVPATLNHGVLNGKACFVAHGAGADLVLVLARAPGTEGLDGLSLVALPSGTPGMSIAPLTSMDLTRPYAEISFADVTVAPEQILGDEGQQGEGIRRALAVAAVMLAAEQLGGADRALEITLDYVKQRVQFDRIIGSFQVIKHMLADMMIDVEAARSVVYYAACTIDEAPEALEEAAAIARSVATDAFNRCAASMIQAHGAIGCTWEHEAHLYFKRARSSANLLGDADHHREILARTIGLDDTALETIG